MNEVIYGYWQDYACTEDTPCSAAQAPKGVDIVSLAFGVFDADDSSKINAGLLTKQSSKQQVKADIATLKARGVKVLVSLTGHPKLNNGGWSDINPIVFANNTKALLEEWDLDGIDLDNENHYALGKQFSVVIKTLRAVLGADAIISMPDYMGASYTGLLKGLQNQLSYVWTTSTWDDLSGQRQLLQRYKKPVSINKQNVEALARRKPGQYKPHSAMSSIPANTQQTDAMLWH